MPVLWVYCSYRQKTIKVCWIFTTNCIGVSASICFLVLETYLFLSRYNVDALHAFLSILLTYVAFLSQFFLSLQFLWCDWHFLTPTIPSFSWLRKIFVVGLKTSYYISFFIWAMQSKLKLSRYFFVSCKVVKYPLVVNTAVSMIIICFILLTVDDKFSR